MIFEKAYKELMSGKKIRRKQWEPLMHMRFIDNVVRTFKGEYTQFYDDAGFLMNDGWMIVGTDVKLSFIQAIEELKNKQCLTRQEWIDDGKEHFIFIDNGQFALCRQVEFGFMPTWTCLNAPDWELMK